MFYACEWGVPFTAPPPSSPIHLFSSISVSIQPLLTTTGSQSGSATPGQTQILSDDNRLTIKGLTIPSLLALTLFTDTYA